MFKSDSLLDAHKISIQKLAFLGDAVYELMVRNEVICNCDGHIGELNSMKVKRVCCDAQSQLYEKIKDLLTSEEMEIYKRGRNSHVGAVPKKASPTTYRRATGLEALFGFLYLSGKIDRLNEFISYL